MPNSHVDFMITNVQFWDQIYIISSSQTCAITGYTVNNTPLLSAIEHATSLLWAKLPDTT